MQSMASSFDDVLLEMQAKQQNIFRTAAVSSSPSTIDPVNTLQAC
jgi:hypothetical protein